jgi:cytoskeletal protein RodZ
MILLVFNKKLLKKGVLKGLEVLEVLVFVVGLFPCFWILVVSGPVLEKIKYRNSYFFYRF